MVKIVNIFGDVKVGKQGEVVYQRKHREQIRRMVSPKRAIASQRQIAHRQLYRAALDWRSQLSLPNRRYLDGYCIANGIIDSYGIPLPWSRFALKLYLQAIKFILTDISFADPTYGRQKYERYEPEDHTGFPVKPPYYPGQTFTPQVTHALNGLTLLAYRKGSPPLVKFVIKECDAQHKPTGDELSFVWIDLSGISIASGGEWVIIDLPSMGVAADKEYCYYAFCPDADGDNWVALKMDDADSTYPRGVKVVSTDGGLTWTTYSDQDFAFREWTTTTIEGKKTATLHIRHPALLTVVQKRGEQTIRGYDTLSSLDEEYLTKQVGLDVETGDSIEATTVAGVKASLIV